MRTIVTGGAGFIGSHLALRLAAVDHEVLVIDDLSKGKRENVGAAIQLAEVSVVSPEVERVIAEFRPDNVFHLAAQMDVRQSVADPAFDARVNVEGTVRVAGAAVRAGVKTFVFASSGGAIYGEQERFPAAEDHRRRADSPYGIAKGCAELYLDYFGRGSRMRVVALRYANVYGPRQDPHGEAGVVAIFAGKMLAGLTPTIYGDGRQTRDYVFVDDVVRANLLALRHDQAQGAYNIGTGLETDLLQLAGALRKATGYEGEIVHADAKPGEQRRSVLDIGRAGRELHWQPQCDLDSGIRKTVEWFGGRR
ncbi:MAG: NAD-dependent epimerase/dehydratase family protein [Deltaproteobacteria bacterium]|nr:NAD-dependent epimerase/dehydratase family protein [Deltaproteobacteria bacterium]